MSDRDSTIALILILLLLWKRPTWSEVNMCYIDPDTGECLPVPGA